MVSQDSRVMSMKSSTSSTVDSHNGKTVKFIKLCLAVALLSVIVHQAAMYQSYTVLNGLDDKLRNVRESKSFNAPPPSRPTITETENVKNTRSTYIGKRDSMYRSASIIAKEYTKPIPPQQNGTVTVRNFTPCPKEFRKLAWFLKTIHHKLYEPVIRAFHSHGWSITKDPTVAHMLWTDQPSLARELFLTLKPWQRLNQLPYTKEWDDKDKMAYHMNQYYYKRQQETGRQPLHSFPESYVLHDRYDLLRFQRRLKYDNGLDIPWVLKRPTMNQGKGVTILGPHAEELQMILSMIPPPIPSPLNNEFDQPGQKKLKKKLDRFVIQRYICDEMTYDGRKFDFRIFWMVASVDPLIVLYHTKHNYVRIGHAKYDESNFTNTRSHLTTHTFGANEKKATWDEFKVYIEEHQSLQGERLMHLKHDPFQHVENQIMHVISNLADAYKNITFHTRDFTSDNAFTLHAADMIIDNDLDVYIIEGTDGPGKDEDYDFRIEMHNAIFGSVVEILQEITERQSNGLPLDVNEMMQKGVLGDFEVIYNNDWMYEYTDYERLRVSNKRGCDGGKNGDDESMPSVSMDNVVKKAKSTALPKPKTTIREQKLKPFYMEYKTNRLGEPVTRSFRRNGWSPVDYIEMAQIIYDVAQPLEDLDDDEYYGPAVERDIQSWQFYNHFPMQMEDNFFKWDNLIKYTDRQQRNRWVCNPLLYKRRRMTVNVYLFIVSVDPFIVYYHDGFLDIPYSKINPNEFLELPSGQNVGLNQTKTAGSENGRIWHGSWKSFEYNLYQAFDGNAFANAKNDNNVQIYNDPMTHVKGQFKRKLINLAEGFEIDARSFLTKRRKIELASSSVVSFPHYFGLYRAQFTVSKNLNAFFLDIKQWDLIYGESYQEIVDLHNDVFGSAFQLLETINTTLNNHRDRGKTMTTQSLLDDTAPVQGRYELLIFDPNLAVADKGRQSSTYYKFDYDWTEKPGECAR